MDCLECPYADYDGDERCDEKLFKDLCNILERKNAEIERLNGNLFAISNACMQRRNEAIEEFAYRLTDKADLIKVNAFDSKWAISQEAIDNLVKEMDR